MQQGDRRGAGERQRGREVAKNQRERQEISREAAGGQKRSRGTGSSEKWVKCIRKGSGRSQ
jgi:hypothetical protein